LFGRLHDHPPIWTAEEGQLT